MLEQKPYKIGNGVLFALAALALLHALVVAWVEAEPIRGPDILGLAKVKAKDVINELDNGSSLGYLDATFGDPTKQLKKILNSGKVIAVRAHMIDGTCIRNNSCPPGAPKYKDLQTLKKRTEKYSKIAKQYPHIKFYVSPFLEHDCKDKSLVEKWYAAILSVDPNLRHVCSAFSGWCPDGVFREKHGNNVRGDITSNDGESLFDSSPDYRDSGSLIVFGWINQFNGRVTGEKGKPPPPKLRVNWPTKDDLRQVKYILREPEPFPDPPPNCDTIKRPELSKTNAEYYGKGKDDGRGNKPLFITKKKYQKITVHRKDGKQVGWFSYYGPYSGGGHRHYMGKIGSGQTPVKLMDALGSEWGIAKAKGQCWPINAIRRIGFYR